MAEDNFALTTFYASWKEYQDHIKSALAPLTAEQLELRAAPHLRSIWRDRPRWQAGARSRARSPALSHHSGRGYCAAARGAAQRPASRS